MPVSVDLPTYRPAGYPTIPDGEPAYLTSEFQKIANALGAITPLVGGARTVLSANSSLRVDQATGSDNNDGITAPFQTISKAVKAAYAVDGRTFDITVSVAPGTYNEDVLFNGPLLTSGTVSLIGDNSATTIIHGTTAAALTVQNNALLTLNGFKITSAADGVVVQKGGGLILSSASPTANSMTYGACAVRQLFATNFGRINLAQNAHYSVDNGVSGFAHMEAFNFGSIAADGALNAAFNTNSFAYTYYVATIAQIFVSAVAYSGAVTNTTNIFHVDTQAVLNTGGRATPAGVTGVLPGQFLRTDQVQLGGIVI